MTSHYRILVTKDGGGAFLILFFLSALVGQKQCGKDRTASSVFGFGNGRQPSFLQLSLLLPLLHLSIDTDETKLEQIMWNANKHVPVVGKKQLEKKTVNAMQ